jgi:hypothetical protein
MKKIVFALVLAICALDVWGQNAPKDLILLLDTSASMSGSYRQVNEYLSGDFLREYLKMGDTFHLIPFSDKPRVDIARRIEGRGELETIIGRIFLQYPLDAWSDIPLALSFAEEYAAALPARPKKIVLVSDGLTLPAQDSPSRALDAAGLDSLITQVRGRLGRQGVSLDFKKVIPGQALSAPRPQQAATGQQAVTGQQSALGGQQAASGQQVVPGQQATPGQQAIPGQQAAPGQQATPGQQAASGQQSALGGQQAASGQQATPGQQAVTGQQTAPNLAGGFTSAAGSSQASGAVPPSAAQQVPGGTVPMSPDGQAARETESSGTFEPGQAADYGEGREPGVEVPPASDESGTSGTGQRYTEPAGRGQNQATPASPQNYAGPPISLFVILGLVGLTALVLIIVFASKKLHGSPNRAMAKAAAPVKAAGQEPRFKDHSVNLAEYAEGMSRQRSTPYSDRRYQAQEAPQAIDYRKPVMLNLFVEDQNTFIGKRNIHSVSPGHSFTVGGGASDFSIFLVPVPATIGEIRNDGTKCNFFPRKPQYFPDIGSQQVPDCIGKTIRVLSDKKYELRFRFELYEDPLLALNRLLNSVRVPG